MNKTHFWIKISDAALAGLCLVAALLLSPDWPTRGLVLLHGLVWAGLGWRLGLSQALMQFQLLLALRLPQTAELSAGMRFASALGGAAWLLALWNVGRLFALFAGLLWCLPAVILPPLWPLVLSAYPRLGRVQDEHAELARWPGIFLLLAALGYAVSANALPPEFFRLTDPEAYTAWGTALAGLFQHEVLWIAIPIAGVFEISQKLPSDLRITWRNLPSAGLLLCALFFAPPAAIAFFLWVALPLSAILLTRWTLALPGWPPRVALWVALVAFALPLLFGGPA